MSSQHSDRDKIFSSIDDTLFTAKLGLQLLYSDDPRERMAGLRNVIVFGRSVTFVLQKLRGKHPGFDKWYQIKVTEMKANPLMRYMNQLRNEVLKEGELAVTHNVQITNLEIDMDKIFRQAPPNAISFFISDKIGGNGWDIQMEDGSIEKFYTSVSDLLPGATITQTAYFASAPDELNNIALIEHCQVYINTLEGIVLDAKENLQP